MKMIDNNKDKLMVRERIKAKNPRFVRQDAHRFVKKMGAVWRKPRGHHSKMRLSRRGKAAMVKNGYRSPKSVRGMTREGMTPINVHNKHDIAKLDSKVHVAIIGASVGKKKKQDIITAAQQKGIRIFNMRDAREYKDRIQREMSERKKARSQFDKRTEKKAEEKTKREDKTLEEISAEKTKAEQDAQKEEKRRQAEKVMIKK
ncbi:50S ribosomal protein L32e [Candidatus Woesearchaeota archaeon]|nr:50S ribosomal protein L32e [Candidatus Woesearchaeota archaeon]